MHDNLVGLSRKRTNHMGKPINWQPHLSQGAPGELKSATAKTGEFRRAKITVATHFADGFDGFYLGLISKIFLVCFPAVEIHFQPYSMSRTFFLE